MVACGPLLGGCFMAVEAAVPKCLDKGVGFASLDHRRAGNEEKYEAEQELLEMHGGCGAVGRCRETMKDRGESIETLEVLN